MTSFHPRGPQSVHARKFKNKRPRSNSDSFQEEHLRQSFQWVSEQLMLIKKNLVCACLGRGPYFQDNYCANLPKYTLQCHLISLGEKKSTLTTTKKMLFSFPPLTPHSPHADEEPSLWGSLILPELGEAGWRLLCYSLQGDQQVSDSLAARL